MKKSVALIAVLASAVLAGSAYAIASDTELEALAAELRAGEVECEQARENLDTEVRRNTRPLFRTLISSIIAAPTLDEARARAELAGQVLAAPGPAPSVSKYLHEQTRRAGAVCIQAIRRGANGAEGLIGS